ncbi:MAG: diacylglycerol kinase family lipid kinase [Anaerolineae bacterium]
MQTMLIYNPGAGSGHFVEELDLIVGMLHRRGWTVRVAETRAPGDAADLAREAVEMGCEMALVAGGDGTISSAIQGLVGSRTALGVIPAGTGNVLARQLGMPVPMPVPAPLPLMGTVWRQAVELILGGTTRYVDLGKVTSLSEANRSRHLLCWAGVGIDAAITQEVELFPRLKRRLGVGAFLVSAVHILRHYAGTRAVLSVDGKRVPPRRIVLAVVANMDLYGGFLHIAPEAAMDDGLLDLGCFHGDRWFDTIYHGLTILFRRHVRNPRVSRYQARMIEIETAQPLPVHVDAEPFGTTPIRVEVVPQALRLIVPSTAPAHIFKCQAVATTEV